MSPYNYVRMMAGPNDDRLKWPFEAKITIQLINWKCDGNHIRHTLVIDCDDAVSKRVIDDGLTSAHGLGWPCFISHEELLDTTSEDILYIEDDTIKLRVVDIQCWGKAATSSTGMLSIILYMSVDTVNVSWAMSNG